MTASDLRACRCGDPVRQWQHDRRRGGHPPSPSGPDLLAHCCGHRSRAGRGVPGERRRVVDRCRVVEGGPRLRLGPDHGLAGRRGLPGRSLRRGSRARSGRGTGPSRAGRCAHPRWSRPAARGRQEVPSLVAGGRCPQGTPDLAGRGRRLLGLQPGERLAAPGVRATGLRVALLLEHAGAAAGGDVPRRRGPVGGERLARVRAPGPAPRITGRWPPPSSWVWPGRRGTFL